MPATVLDKDYWEPLLYLLHGHDGRNINNESSPFHSIRVFYIFVRDTLYFIPFEFRYQKDDLSLFDGGCLDIPITLRVLIYGTIRAEFAHLQNWSDRGIRYTK